MSDYATVPTHDQEEVGHAYDQPPSKYAFLRKKSTILVIGAAVALLATSAYVLGSSNELSPYKVHYQTPGISEAHFADGVAKCQHIRAEKHQYPTPQSRTFNPRFVNGTAPTLLKNAFILDGESAEGFRGDLLLDKGLIVLVGGTIEAPKGAKIIDLKGRIVTPGIVDMHSHLGVDSWPELDATSDTNEMTQPLTPFIRSIDGFNPSDPAREWVLSGGVTTSLILPGSGNIIGGEAYTFKLRKVDTLSNEDMLVEAGVKDKWRYMKMACGENPKRFYGNFYHIMPSTRLGEGWLLRDQFAKATALKTAQDDWCDAAESIPHFGRHRLSTPFPEDLQYESLVGILREDVRLNIHCYETHDLEAMVRHSNEYKFKIRAFHHALDAYRVPEILKRAYKNVPTVATFAGKFGYKKEAFQSSVNSPKILTDAGIAVAMKSDHPVLNSQHLIYEAAQARHYGLSEQLALASVTSVPAKALGLDHRIGKIAVGMDADVVIWSKHPLSLGAHPLQVYVDGISQIENADEKEWQQQSVPEAFPEFPKMKTPENDKNSCTPKAKTAIFTGLNKVYWGDMKEYQHASEGELKVVVRDGEVVCAGRCNDKVRELQRGGEDIPVYDLGGKGVAIPSLVAFAPPNLGLTEIAAEDSTGDGHPNLKSPLTYAADGLKFGGLHMNEAFKAGVLVSVTAPDSEHVIQGISTAFRTGAESTIVGDGIIKEQAALHVKIGQGVKSELFPTVSSQIAFLRTLLDKALNAHIESEYTPVINGKIPLVVEVNNRDEIIRVVELKKQLEKQGAKLRLTLFGAVEAWTVAEYLAENHVGVVLKPYKCTPVEWTAQKCLPGAPLTQDTSLTALYKAGVKVGLSVHEAEDVRQLVWVAGWARSDLGLSDEKAVDFISKNLRELAGLESSKDVVIYDGNPFEFGAKISAIVGGGKTGVFCNPRAF